MRLTALLTAGLTAGGMGLWAADSPSPPKNVIPPSARAAEPSPPPNLSIPQDAEESTNIVENQVDAPAAVESPAPEPVAESSAVVPDRDVSPAETAPAADCRPALAVTPAMGNFHIAACSPNGCGPYGPREFGDAPGPGTGIATPPVPPAYLVPGPLRLAPGPVHDRYPYYSARRPWYTPGPASANVTIAW